MSRIHTSAVHIQQLKQKYSIKRTVYLSTAIPLLHLWNLRSFPIQNSELTMFSRVYSIRITIHKTAGWHKWKMVSCQTNKEMVLWRKLFCEKWWNVYVMCGPDSLIPLRSLKLEKRAKPFDPYYSKTKQKFLPSPSSFLLTTEKNIKIWSIMLMLRVLWDP